MNTEFIHKLALTALEDMKGKEIVSLDIRAMSTIADYMIVATATSNRHARSLADEVQKRSKEAGLRPRSVEGLEAADWVLIDLGDVVVHVMQAATRSLYDLESLWRMSPSS